MTDRTDPTDQENPMSKTDRHDELVALLSKISEESVTTSNVLDDMLDLLREHLPEPRKPMPDLTPEQERRIARAPKNPWTPPASADDLPGEPVEPGDLQAGDKVAFTWWGVEHSTCTLVSVAGGSILRADANDAGDRGIPYVVIRGGWAGGISDVRLIERGPREGEDPDEALARVIARHLDISWNGTNEAGRSDLCTAARAAREHIEAEQEEVVATLREEVAIQTARAEQAEVWMSKWQQSCNDARDERDALRERLDALRDDIVNGRLLSAAEAAFGGWLIARDDERAAKGGSDA